MPLKIKYKNKKNVINEAGIANNAASKSPILIIAAKPTGPKRDAFYFYSKYNDFIATRTIIQPLSGQVSDLKNASTSKVTGVNVNKNEIYVNGAGIGLEYAIGKGYNVSGNYTYQVGTITLKAIMEILLKTPSEMISVKEK